MTFASVRSTLVERWLLVVVQAYTISFRTSETFRVLAVSGGLYCATHTIIREGDVHSSSIFSIQNYSSCASGFESTPCLPWQTRRGPNRERPLQGLPIPVTNLPTSRCCHIQAWVDGIPAEWKERVMVCIGKEQNVLV